MSEPAQVVLINSVGYGQSGWNKESPPAEAQADMRILSWNYAGHIGFGRDPPPPPPWYTDADYFLAASILILVAVFAAVLVRELRRESVRNRLAVQAKQIRAAAEEVLDAMDVSLVGDHREAALQVIRVHILDVDITEDGWFEHLRKVVARERDRS